MRTRRIVLSLAAVAVVAAIGAVVAFGATTSGSSSYWGMMGGRYVYRPAHTTAIQTLPAARAEAQKFADRLGLRVDEVLQFRANFYAKLVDRQGNGATEVLVDPTTGAVGIEYGPAMMWNTRYGMGRSAASMMGSYGRSMMGGSGMMGGGSGTTGSMMGSGGSSGMMGNNTPGAGATSSTAQSMSLASAHRLAQRWLDRHEPGVKVETGGDAFPGYYTLETLRSGKITGMISVNATTGAIWMHWWHGAFIAKSE